MHGHVDARLQEAASQEGLRHVLGGIGITEFIGPHGPGQHDGHWHARELPEKKLTRNFQSVRTVRNNDGVRLRDRLSNRLENQGSVGVGQVKRVFVQNVPVGKVQVGNAQTGDDNLHDGPFVAKRAIMFIEGFGYGSTGADYSHSHFDSPFGPMRWTPPLSSRGREPIIHVGPIIVIRAA